MNANSNKKKSFCDKINKKSKNGINSLKGGLSFIFILFFQKSFCREFSLDQKNPQFMRSTQLRNIFLLLNGFSIPWQSHVYLLLLLFKVYIKFKGINWINNGPLQRRCFFIPKAFLFSLFCWNFGLIQNSHFNLECSQVKICYFGSFMGVIFPWEDTANMFIACVACVM